MDNRIDSAISLFGGGFNCAQSVLSVFSDDVSLDKETALKISSGFGGGIGRMGEVCGAVTGGIIVIGAKYGMGLSGRAEDADTTHSKSRELMDNFTRIHGTYLCRELIKGYDTDTEEGRDLKNKICRKCIAGVVEDVEEMLEKENNRTI